MDTILHSLLVGTSIINLAIVGLLLYVYLKNLRYIRSKYNAGLLMFSVLFFIEYVLILHLGIFQWPNLGDIVDIIIAHMVTINIIQMAGLFAMLYITWK